MARFGSDCRVAFHSGRMPPAEGLCLSVVSFYSNRSDVWGFSLGAIHHRKFIISRGFAFRSVSVCPRSAGGTHKCRIRCTAIIKTRGCKLSHHHLRQGKRACALCNHNRDQGTSQFPSHTHPSKMARAQALTCSQLALCGATQVVENRNRSAVAWAEH